MCISLWLIIHGLTFPLVIIQYLTYSYRVIIHYLFIITHYLILITLFPFPLWNNVYINASPQLITSNLCETTTFVEFSKHHPRCPSLPKFTMDIGWMSSYPYVNYTLKSIFHPWIFNESLFFWVCHLIFFFILTFDKILQLLTISEILILYTYNLAKTSILVTLALSSYYWFFSIHLCHIFISVIFIYCNIYIYI